MHGGEELGFEEGADLGEGYEEVGVEGLPVFEVFDSGAIDEACGEDMQVERLRRRAKRAVLERRNGVFYILFLFLFVSATHREGGDGMEAYERGGLGREVGAEFVGD